MRGYQAFEQANGKWRIPGIPCAVPHRVWFEGADQPFEVDEAWLRGALERDQRRWEEDDYLGPLHVGHGHGPERGIGHYRLSAVKPIRFEGEAMPCLYANWIDIDPETFAAIDAGQFPYQSPEILDFSSGQIDAIALLGRQPPHFRFPLIRIAKKHPFKQRTPAGSPYCASATKAGGVLYQRSSSMKKRGGYMAEEDMLPDAEVTADEGEFLEDEEGMDYMDGDDLFADEPEPPVDLEDGGVAEPEDDDPDAEYCADDDEEPGPRDKVVGGGDYSAAGMRERIKRLETENARLTARQDATDRERRIQKRTRQAVRALTPYGYSADSIAKRAAKYARQGDAALKAYVVTAREAAMDGSSGSLGSMPPAGWDDTEAMGAGESPVPRSASPEAQRRGAQYGAEFRQMQSMGMLKGKTEKDFVRDQLVRDGLMKPAKTTTRQPAEG